MTPKRAEPVADGSLGQLYVLGDVALRIARSIELLDFLGELRLGHPSLVAGHTPILFGFAANARNVPRPQRVSRRMPEMNSAGVAKVIA
jgi:hypothetical protein